MFRNAYLEAIARIFTANIFETASKTRDHDCPLLVPPCHMAADILPRKVSGSW